MPVARDIMTPGVECIDAEDTVLDAACTLTRLGVGALPIRGSDGSLLGVLTDRDIVIKVLGKGKDPQQTKAGELAQGVVTIGADDDADEIFRTMAGHKVRRLPVIDGRRLVGMVALADVARALPNLHAGSLLEALSADSPPAGHRCAPASPVCVALGCSST